MVTRRFVLLVNGALEEILRSAGTTAADDLVAHSLLLVVDCVLAEEAPALRSDVLVLDVRMLLFFVSVE